jgi:predicted HAD superfamily Cof-like phosphohydrolase
MRSFGRRNQGCPCYANLCRTKLAKELADLLVVAYGTAEVFGIDLDWAFVETMASNMTKLDSNGKPIYREDGKVLKGPNYRPPNMEVVVYGTLRDS